MAGRDLAMRGQAVGEGSAKLSLRGARGREVGHGVAEVRVPDAVELDAHGSLILGHDDERRSARRGCWRAARRRTWCGTSATGSSCTGTGCCRWMRAQSTFEDQRDTTCNRGHKLVGQFVVTLISSAS